MNNSREKKEIDLFEYWRVIVKRKWAIIVFAGSLIFFTGIFSFLATPLYKSTATLLLEEESSRILNIEETLGYQAPMERDLRSFNTQIKLLMSKSLAERVVKKMNLVSHPEFGFGKKHKKSLLALAKDVVTFRWIPHKKEAKEENVDPSSSIAKTILDNLKVDPVKETKLIEVSYTSSSARLAAEIVNTIAEEFINFSIEKRYETTQRASGFLSEQIANLREDLAAKERELQKYGQEKNLFFLSDTASTAVNKLSELNSAYTQAQIDLIKAEATYRELKDLKADSLPQFVNDPVIQQLKAEYSRMKNEYEEKRKVFKPDYPEMIQLKARLDSMFSELKKAVDAAESEYRTALNKEASLKNLLNYQRVEVQKMNSNAILYNSLKIEVENKRKLLNSLGERQNETLVSARLGGLKASNISIIDKAEVSKSPISPRKAFNLLLALLIGVFGGMGLCFVLEYLDNTLKGPEDVEKLAGLSSLGLISCLSAEGMKEPKGDSYYVESEHPNSLDKENPKAEDTLPDLVDVELVNLHYPRLPISEDYRTVRTSILFSQAGNPPKTILFTSALPQEGKTCTVVNMAISFAQLQERVLVIEADLRRPRLHRIFKVRNVKGLSGYLTGKEVLKDAIQMTSVENVWLLPCGPIPPNPVELINSKKMKDMLEEVREVFDVILIDSPPVLVVVDSVIISSLTDCTALVIHAGKTTRNPFLNAVSELKKAKAKIIGVVFNKVDVKKRSYYYRDYSRSHYYHQYGYKSSESKPEKKVEI